LADAHQVAEAGSVAAVDWPGRVFLAKRYSDSNVRKDAWTLNRSGFPETAKEQREHSAQQWKFFPTQAKKWLESAIRLTSTLLRDQTAGHFSAGNIQHALGG